MDMWIVSRDQGIPMVNAKKLSQEQINLARTGKVFIARASSPVFARAIAETLKTLEGKLETMSAEDLQNGGLQLRMVPVGRSEPDVPMYEAIFAGPSEHPRVLWPFVSPLSLLSVY